jgi:hypothetical protein
MTDPCDEAEPSGHSLPMLVTVITAAVAWVALRVWVITAAEAPNGPDNVGPWAAAFVWARADPRIDMADLPPYSVGTGGILSPILLVVDDPVLRYRIGIGVLSCLAVAAAYAVARTVRSTLRCGVHGLLVAMLVGTLGTAIAFTTSFTWVEPVAFAYFGVWLALASWTFAGSAWLPVMLVGAYTGAAVLIHGRFTLLAPAWFLIVAWWEFSKPRQGRDRRRSLLVLAGLAITIGAAMVLARWLRVRVIDAAWSQASFDSDVTFAHMVDDIHYWAAVVQSTIGQAWYVVTSTFGLAVVGAWNLLRIARGESESDSARWTAVAALVGSGVVYATSVLWIAPAILDPAPPPWFRGRWDHLVHGRYLDAVAVTLAAFGAAALASRRNDASRRVLALSMVAIVVLFGAIVALEAWADPTLEDLNAGSIPGVSGFPVGAQAHLARWSAVGVVIGGILLLVSQRGRLATFCAVAVVMTLCAVSGSRLAVQRMQRFDSSALYAGVPASPTPQRALVAADAMDSTAFRYGFPVQQFVLAPSNWSFEISALESHELASGLPSDAGLTVMWWDATPEGSWCLVGEYGRLRIWVTRSLVPDESDGCTS